ncbi:MAG TPA: hypothetical protein VMA30_08350 [Xanthobacteraceae bacterium]|nr:hypothetical protein [Xanthobacteraceae bacterium]
MHLEGATHSSLSGDARRLPKRFPVGSTYVVEGRRGENGHLRVFSRYVMLPDGRRINLDADLGGTAALRARRTRGRQAVAAASTPAGGKPRSARPKKISVDRGTPRRNRR